MKEYGKDLLTLIQTRRSIRKFKPDMVPKDIIDKITAAGTYAPTGMNRQSPIIIAVTNKEVRDRLSKLNAEIMGIDSDPFYGAPTVVVVFADSRRGTCVEDGSLVMGNLMNAAFSLGVDSCWIHRAREVFQTEEGKALMKKWGLGEEYIGIGNCILGYGDKPLPQAKPRKEGFVIRA